VKLRYKVLIDIKDKELQKKITNIYDNCEYPVEMLEQKVETNQKSGLYLKNFDIIFTTITDKTASFFNELHHSYPETVIVAYLPQKLNKNLDKNIIVLEQEANESFLINIIDDITHRMYELNEYYELIGTSKLIRFLSDEIHDIDDMIERVHHYLSDYIEFEVFEVISLLKRGGEKPQTLFTSKRKIDRETRNYIEKAQEELEKNVDHHSPFLSFYEFKNTLVATFNLGIYDDKPLYGQIVTDVIKRDLCFQILNEFFFKVIKRTLSYLDATEFKNMFKELAHKDDVTGLYNQRKLYLDLERLIKSEEIFTVLFIDVDNFKDVNDGYGHVVGSDLLSKLSIVFKDSIRQTDYFYRYGGDEFVILLPDTSAKDSKVVAQRLLKHVKTQNFEIKDKGNTHLSVSIGVAEYPKDAANAQEIISIADNMMYNSKKSGRGQVMTTSEMTK
jgi:diguanylate cyclase (GGDEF)-like protein